MSVQVQNRASVQVQIPAPGAIVLSGASLTIGGVATGKGYPEPSFIERVPVEIDGGAPIVAMLKQLPHHPGSPPAWSFHANATAPAMPGSHQIRVHAFDHTGSPPATATVYFVVGLPFTATVTFKTASDYAKGPFTFAVVIGTNLRKELSAVLGFSTKPTTRPPSLTCTIPKAEHCS